MDKIKEVTEELLDDHVDDHVDEEIQRCFLKEDPKCFFVFAGAGSGKTRSLIKTLTFLDETLGDWLLTNRKQIAVITYTNAACDEISRRLHYKSIFSVSTIHRCLGRTPTWYVPGFQTESLHLHQMPTHGWQKCGADHETGYQAAPPVLTGLSADHRQYSGG